MMCDVRPHAGEREAEMPVTERAARVEPGT